MVQSSKKNRTKSSPANRIDIEDAQRWPVEREWRLLAGGSSKVWLDADDLRSFRVFAALGAAGLGKTYELKYLADLDRQDGLDVRFERLADREVEIYRRKVSDDLGGTAGSEVDVLCTIPAVGMADAIDPIRIPVEVKLSHNSEARTGLRDQLVNRYMTQLGANCGIFVVAWMGKPSSGTAYRPIWNSLTNAQQELNDQASDVSRDSSLFVKAIVIDASLATVQKPKKKAKKASKKLGARIQPRKQLNKTKATTSKKRPVKKKAAKKKPGRSSD